MTRETKIGLLVGLAFIIVIGILLSDHINSSSDPAPAAMGKGFDEVKQSVASPDARNQGSVVMVPPPQPIIPTNPVQTSRDPQPAQNNGSVIQIGPGTDPSQFPRPARPVQQPDSVQVFPPAGPEVASNDAPNPPQPTTPDNAVSGPLAGVAQQHGEELVGIGGPVQIRPTPQPTTPTALNKPAAPLPPGVRQIKAEEGDTVTKLAAKYMGGNSKANREAIIRANPNMGPDGRKLFAGQTYLIPAASTASAGPVAISAEQPAPRPAPTPAPAPVVAPLPAGVTMYTVKDNDSLWKIASEQLGSGNRWAEIRDLNPDVLKGSEQVHANMRLKLPAKAVASSN
jgi:nucleoid-associated protein YgaU